MNIVREVHSATPSELAFYLAGAARDGTFNRTHRTFRFAQREIAWLETLKTILERLGRRGWIYREGTRDVWVLETTYRPIQSAPRTNQERSSFARGYFDAEGGVPRMPDARFYIQFVQKDRADLSGVRDCLVGLGIACGRLHNPSVRVDPEYWRFYVLSSGRDRFVREVGS